jgi:competence protein ComEC
MTNLLVIPLLGAVLWLILLTVSTGVLWLPAGGLAGAATGAALSLLQNIVTMAASVPNAALRVVSPGPVAGALLFAAAVALCAAIYYPRQRISSFVAGVCGVIAIAVWGPAPPKARVVFLDVGHGDATAVHTPEGATVLVDAGDHSEFVQRAQDIVAPYLRAHGVSKLAAVVVTHMDRDHAGGVPFILENFPVGNLILPLHSSGRERETGILALCHKKRIPVRRVQAGDVLSVGGSVLRVLNPPVSRGFLTSINDLSVVLRVSWEEAGGEFSVLLPGDIEAAGEQGLSQKACQALILKAPHHGSATSSTPALLRAVRPEAAVISTGGRSGPEGVAQDILERYSGLGVPILRTDHHGGIAARQQRGAAILTPAVPFSRSLPGLVRASVPVRLRPNDAAFAR